MTDISGFGLEVRLVASNTFPIGITVSQFADDGDPLDVAAIQIADKAMGLNGDLVSWSKATPITMILNMLPNTDDDINLSLLSEANRVGRGKSSAKDKITAVISYPSGKTVTLTKGVMTDAMTTNSVASAGRHKTKPYTFAFEGKLGT